MAVAPRKPLSSTKAVIRAKMIIKGTVPKVYTAVFFKAIKKSEEVNMVIKFLNPTNLNALRPFHASKLRTTELKTGINVKTVKPRIFGSKKKKAVFLLRLIVVLL